MRGTESCLSWVPEKGTVGASGDLTPLSHLALGLIGEGQMWSPETGWADARQVSFIMALCQYHHLLLDDLFIRTKTKTFTKHRVKL